VIRAALFDVGDTIFRVRGDAAAQRRAVLARLVARFGPRGWYEDLLGADLLCELLRDDPAEPMRQRTLVVLGRWLATKDARLAGAQIDELRGLVAVPRAIGTEVAPHARETLERLRADGLRIVLVSNTLWTGDDELRADIGELGLEPLIDGVVTSHSTGYRKPHPAIFDRALALAGAAGREAFMVGDEPYQDVFGAQRAGMRGVWLRYPPPRPQPVGAPRGFDVRADAEIRSLAELPEVYERWRRTDRV
jgi:HAD superfamily hydrolase (TIGR01509 family)